MFFRLFFSVFQAVFSIMKAGFGGFEGVLLLREHFFLFFFSDFKAGGMGERVILKVFGFCGGLF